MAGRDWERVRDVLDALLRSRPPVQRLGTDPVGLVRRYAGADDREVAGLVCACLAFGRADIVRRNAADALGRMGPSPAAYIDRLEPARARRDLRGWRHRTAGSDDLARLLLGAGAARRKEGSLGRSFARAFRGDLREALADFVDALGGPGMGNLLPDPLLGGPCKRLNLYLRWMVRPDDGVDFGVWQGVPTSALVIPLDTHIHRISRYVGFTHLKTPRWEAAAEITRALSRLDPADPLKYDFALCHLGISGACRQHRVDAVCATCDLREICRLPRRG